MSATEPILSEKFIDYTKCIDSDFKANVGSLLPDNPTTTTEGYSIESLPADKFGGHIIKFMKNGEQIGMEVYGISSGWDINYMKGKKEGEKTPLSSLSIAFNNLPKPCISVEAMKRVNNTFKLIH